MTFTGPRAYDSGLVGVEGPAWRFACGGGLFIRFPSAGKLSVRRQKVPYIHRRVRYGFTEEIPRIKLIEACHDIRACHLVQNAADLLPLSWNVFKQSI